MVRTLVAFLCVVFTAAVAAQGASDAAGRQVATLRLLDSSPVKVRGVGFRANERVRVKASLEAQARSKVVYASRTGTFTATFTALTAPDPCTVEVIAIRSSGGRVFLKLAERMCPPPLAP